MCAFCRGHSPPPGFALPRKPNEESEVELQPNPDEPRRQHAVRRQPRTGRTVVLILLLWRRNVKGTIENRVTGPPRRPVPNELGDAEVGLIHAIAIQRRRRNQVDGDVGRLRRTFASQVWPDYRVRDRVPRLEQRAGCVCHVVLTNTSHFGIMYVASPVTRASRGPRTWQYGFVGSR